jgi:4-hydroxybenzoate polyprenyltransferase
VAALSLVFAGAVAFNLVSSIVYIINDFKDIDLDRAHSVKKLRPLAAGAMSPLEAYALLVTITGLVFLLIGILDNVVFAAILLSYILLNLLYTYVVKHIPYLDITFISGFAGMRVVSGFVLLGMPVSWILVLVVATLTFFMLTVTRLAEVGVANFVARPVIKKYSPRVLKFLMTAFLMLSVVLYFIAMAFVALPLAYTDALYFLVLFSIYEYTCYTETSKGSGEGGFAILLHSRRTLGLFVLFALVLLVAAVLLRLV